MAYLINQKGYKTAVYVSQIEKYLSCNGDSIIEKNEIDGIDNFIEETELKSMEELERMLKREYEWLFI